MYIECWICGEHWKLDNKYITKYGSKYSEVVTIKVDGENVFYRQLVLGLFTSIHLLCW